MRRRALPELPGERVPEPKVEARDVPLHVRAAKPGGGQVYVRRRLVRCPTCGVVEFPDRRQAVVTLATREHAAYLYCRACGARFKLAIGGEV